MNNSILYLVEHFLYNTTYRNENIPEQYNKLPEGEKTLRKCTLCLEFCKDISVTNCGHVFCWLIY